MKKSVKVVLAIMSVLALIGSVVYYFTETVKKLEKHLGLASDLITRQWTYIDFLRDDIVFGRLNYRDDTVGMNAKDFDEQWYHEAVEPAEDKWYYRNF